jgi:hypothetical protein
MVVECAGATSRRQLDGADGLAYRSPLGRCLGQQSSLGVRVQLLVVVAVWTAGKVPVAVGGVLPVVVDNVLHDLPGAVGGPVGVEGEGVDVRLGLDFLATRGQESAGDHAWCNAKVR